jgi:hypothetical protein
MDDHPRRVGGGEKIEKIADGYMLHQPEKSRVHYLNHTAVMVLELCDGRLSPGEIAGALRELYDLPEAPLAEVGECLALLRKQGLVA